MKPPAYSSLTAFLAHYQALRARPRRTQDESGRLAEMESLIAQLRPPEVQALRNANGGGSERHRERALRHLTQILRHKGVLSG